MCVLLHVGGRSGNKKTLIIRCYLAQRKKLDEVYNDI